LDAWETEFIGTPADFDTSEIKAIAPMTKLIGPEIKIDAIDRSENGTMTDFIGRFR
jgi:hypothetical protein